ncbi:MAG: hypothetical protein NT062_28335, partial [Proteobacteria bacterium]|nr:hypothetical protein [Pseudomonadota bacterium]
MKPEVRRAALRAAAKTAFVVSIGAVGAIGCGGTQPSPPANAVGSTPAPATTPPATTAATCA